MGLDDEMTAPWLLQTRLLNYHVINLALPGYSSVQQLLQYQKLKDNLKSDDIVVLSYSSIDLLHNVADPSLIQALLDGYEISLSSKDEFINARIPYADLSRDGELDIKYTPITCSYSENSNCIRGTPEPAALESVTKELFAEILLNRKCHILIAFLDGTDNDPVASSLRSSGVPMTDLRIKPGVDYDDYLPGEEGGHRGAFAEFSDLYRVARGSFDKSNAGNPMISQRKLELISTVVSTSTRATLSSNSADGCPLFGPASPCDERGDLRE